MPNPRAQQQLAQVSTNPLDRAVQSFKSIKEPAQALGDMLAATLRGSVAATAGAPGDIRELIDLLGPEKVEALLGKRVMPTTEEMKQMLPKATAEPHPYESIGEFLPLPGTGAAIKAAGYGAGRGAGALTRAAGQAVSDAMIHQAGPLASGPLSALAPRMAMTNVVKPKGGNWMNQNFDYSFKRLKSPTVAGETPAQRIVRHEGLLSDYSLSPESKATVERHLNEERQRAAIDNWVDRNLTNYVKNQMATPEDPVRKLAEEGVTHFPVAEDPGYWARHGQKARDEVGGTQMAQSPLAKQWENRTDAMINRESAQEHQDMMHLAPGLYSEKDSWIKNVPPDTPLYSTHGRNFSALDLGFDHIVDVLKQDLASGRIRPDQLNKVSMEQAVRRTHEYDQELAAKMNAERAVAREGLPVHKEYPEGYKWIELNKPGAFNAESEAMGHSVKGYEPPVGHPEWIESSGDRGSLGYGHGGWEAIKSGKAKVYSLVDPKGNPHVTVEVGKNEYTPRWDSVKQYMDQAREQVMRDRAERGLPLTDQYENEIERLVEASAVKMAQENAPPMITQIKGKQNAAPKPEYLPYVQDFVRSGEWSDVGDIQNTGLVKAGKNKYVTESEAKEQFAPRIKNALEFLQTHPAFEEQRAAKIKRDKDLLDMDYGQQQELERIYGAPIYPNSAYSASELSKIIASPEENISSLHDWYPSLNRWLEEAEKGMEHHGHTPPEAGMAAGGKPPTRYPTEQEREAMRKLRESMLPAATEAERQKRIQQNLEKMGNKVSFSDNPDRMWMEVQDQKFAGGGITKLAKLARAPAKTKAEIEAIAERMAPQVLGEYVRASEKSAKTVAGKTQKQFAREKELKHDIRPTEGERPLPKEVNIEDLKNSVLMGISGDPTITGHTLHAVGGRELRSPSPQHGGPLYGLGHDKEHFWASNLGAARNVQNRAREIAEQYDAPVLGNYVMMGPDSYSYAQHFADANLQNIRPEEMTKAQIEGFNKLIRQGSLKSGPRPTWPGIENPEEAYLHMAIDPELRKHFGNLMQMPTVTQQFGLPSGLDVAHAVTEPSLRDLEIGVTGKSMGLMRPDVKDLKLSEHPTYSHDIPGEFMGGMKFPVPYELSFPDSLKAVRENPAQAPQEFGSFKMAGPRQVIDQQLIDEIKAYEERMKKLTGKAAGGEISADDVILEERPL